MNNTDFIADFDIEELEDRLEAIGITPYGIDPNCTGCCSTSCGGGGGGGGSPTCSGCTSYSPQCPFALGPTPKSLTH